jgi:hypothetical protein
MQAVTIGLDIAKSVFQAAVEAPTGLAIFQEAASLPDRD